MPTAVAEPWFAVMSDPFNTCVDSLITLHPTDGKKKVCLMLQFKEHQAGCAQGNPPLSKLGRESRTKMFEWRGTTHATVKAFLDEHDVVFVHVSPNDPPVDERDSTCGKPMTWMAHGKQRFEAVVTNEDIRRWSPTVAYSACDAHVLAMSELPSSAKL